MPPRHCEQSGIEPAPFTRRATISGAFGDFLLAAFAFCLVPLTLRRAANNSHGGR
jgi:hypothetical protein